MKRKTILTMATFLFVMNGFLHSQTPIAMVGNDTATISDMITLTGQSSDSDGTIDSIQWSQLANYDLRFLSAQIFKDGGLGMTIYEINWLDDGTEVIPDLTSNMDQGYTVTDTDSDDGWHAYDGDPGTGVGKVGDDNKFTNTVDVGEGNGVSPDEVRFQIRRANGRIPDSVILRGSYDGEVWHEIGRDPDWPSVETHTVLIDIPSEVPLATISGENSDTANISGLESGFTYHFEYKVWDNDDNVAMDTIAVIVHNAPVAIVGNDTITTADSIELTGNGIDDGTIESYQWTQLSPVMPATLEGASTSTLMAKDLSGGNTYMFELKVTDNFGVTGTDTISVTVNTLPVAMTGEDMTIAEDSIVLIGEGTDADGFIASYNWTNISIPVSMMGDTTDTLTVTGMQPGNTYIFEFMVTDDLGGIAKDTISVTVNMPPDAFAGDDIIVNNDSTTLNGLATDSDGTIVDYMWTQISGPAATLTGENTQDLKVTGLMDDSVYVFRFEVTDDFGATDADTIEVTIDISVSVLSVNIDPLTVSAYPNPLSGNDVLTIELPAWENETSVTIFDANGKTVYTNNEVDSNSLKVPSSLFNTGLYIVKIQNNSRTEQVKLIVE